MHIFIYQIKKIVSINTCDLRLVLTYFIALNTSLQTYYTNNEYIPKCKWVWEKVLIQR
jgi:hypothetical protein